MRQSNRRRFLGQLATGVAVGTLPAGLSAETAKKKDGCSQPAFADLGSAGLATKFWIDPRLAAKTSMPWRKVDIEFHNSQHVPKIGERFNADEFGDQLLKAHINGAVIFAKDMFGYSYYPSNCGPVHPGLSFDLFGAQVAALRKRKIAVFAYYMTTWNLELGERHPDWLVVRRDRTTDLPKFDETFGCSEETGRCVGAGLCLAHEDFVSGELAHIKELASRHELDGVWIDGSDPPRACYCHECLRQMREKGTDPFDERVQYEHKVALGLSFMRRIRLAVNEARPGCKLGPQNAFTNTLGDRISLIDWSDLEGLFTDKRWYGYIFGPTVNRYVRSLGITTYGLTTRFKTFWGDFGGLKLPPQLIMEAATIVAGGVRCDIGDQMHPNARLDPAVYHVIGEAYSHIERLEPYLDQAAPVSEAALLTSGLAFEGPNTEVNFGWVKMLTESRVQFDIVNPAVEWERYSLLILPDELKVDEPTASRLRAFVAKGGSLVVTHKAGLLAGTDRSWLESYGLHFAQMSPFKPAYFVPKVSMTGEIPTYEYALYEGASQWRAESPADVLAVLGEPLYQRSPEHYTSHAQTPFDHVTEYAALARSGQVALFAFPLGQSYCNQGYWIYRQAFQKVLKDLLRSPLIQSDASLSAELALMHQASRPDIGRKERYLVHIVNYSPLRHTRKHTDFCEDPIPLTNVTVRVNLPLKVATAKAIVTGEDLPVRRSAGGGVEVLVPRVAIHEVLSFEGK